MVTGVLALQGDFAEHAAALERQGLEVREVRVPRDLDGLSSIVLPGGETTTMLKLLDIQGLWEPLGAFLRSGVPVLGTCAGMILLAREVSPRQASYGLLDIAVERNGYGRQFHSGTFELAGELPVGTRGVFIRAPRVTRVGADVEVLARREGEPVLVRKGPVLAACFHPELEADHPLTQRFAMMCRSGGHGDSQPPAQPRAHQPEMAEPDP